MSDCFTLDSKNLTFSYTVLLGMMYRSLAHTEEEELENCFEMDDFGVELPLKTLLPLPDRSSFDLCL